MRVLHVYRTYFPDPPGGLQEAIRQIALATLAQGAISRIFTLSSDPVPSILRRPEGEVVRSRSWMAPASCDLGGLAALRHFAEQALWADVIHYHFPWPFADLLHLMHKPQVPAIITYHSDVVRQRMLGAVYAPIRQRMLHSMEHIVATSPAYARTSPVLSGADVRDKVRVIPLGIDEQTYLGEADDSIFKKIGLAKSERFILFVGVLRYYKGLHTLIQAALGLQAKVVIVGSGPEMVNLKELVSQDAASQVVFSGQVTDAEKVCLLQNCRALVLPSHLRSEAYGMVLVEAAMFGKPMVSCEIGTGTSFVNVHGETGFVVPPEDPTALREALRRLLMDDVLANRFGTAARQRYVDHFSGEAMGRAYVKLYQEVQAKNSASDS